ncbi:MAG: HEAT repeat domain-containing protein [Limisphaerales bacterium]
MNLSIAFKQMIRRPAAVGFLSCLCLASVVLAAELNEDVLQRLRNYRYGQDAKVLTEVSQRVAEVTASPGEADQREQLAQRLASLLETDASFECKQFVCRQLALIDTPRQVPVLAKLLTDEKLSDMALYALGPMADPSVGRTLRAALGQTRGKTQVGIINTLGFRRDSQAVPPLAKLLNAPEGDVVRATALALGRIGGKEAARLLKRTVAVATGDNRFVVTDAYLACADGFRTEGKNSPAAAIYQELLAENGSSLTRAAALRGLMTVDEGAAVRSVLASLRGADPILKKTAIGCIRLRQTTETTRRVAAELPQLPVADQVLVLAALADRKDTAAVPAIIAAMGSDDPRVRTAALRALGQVGDAQAVDRLVAAAAAGPSAVEKKAALDSLRVLSGPGIDEGILKHLPTGPASTRVELTGVLVDRNAVSAVPALLNTAADPDPTVAEAAFRALGQMEAPASLPALIQL